MKPACLLQPREGLAQLGNADPQVGRRYVVAGGGLKLVSRLGKGLDPITRRAIADERLERAKGTSDTETARRHRDGAEALLVWKPTFFVDTVLALDGRLSVESPVSVRWLRRLPRDVASSMGGV